MRRLVFLLAVIMVMPVMSAPKEHEKFETNSKWRYKIFTAEHQSIEKGGKKSIKSIFKIDLENGKVWRYRQGIDDDGKKYEEFFEIPEQ